MKKFLALLMTLVMAVSFVVTLSVSSSAAEEKWVEETYSLQEVLDAFGTHEAADDFTLSAEPMFGGVWTYEWFDTNSSSFAPMGVYVNRSLSNEGSNNGWANYYSPYKDCLLNQDEPANYCMFMSNGKQMHPGTGAGPVITYIAPASGTISFYAEVFPYSNAADGNLSTNGETKGNHMYLYVNDTKVWPATEEDSLMYGDTHTQEAPMKVDATAFNVNAGDRVRMVMTAHAGNKGGKGCTIASQPVVTWHTTSDGTAIGNPNGNPPTGVLSSDLKADSAKITWTAAKNAAGYNVYLDGKKVNDAPINATEYVITGLEARTMYEFTITTVTTSGRESEPTQPQSFRTKKAADTATSTTSTSTVTTPVSGEGEGSVTDSVTTDVSNVDSITDSNNDVTTESNDASEKTTSKKPTSTKKTTSTMKTTADEAGFPWWIIIVAGVVVLAAVAVVVFFVLKKKPAEEAAVEGEVAEGEAAEGEAAEEAPEASEDAPEAPTEE